MKGTVVVIGSGPASPELRGEFVDSHPVVRMWNHDWQPAERYGVRYDHGLITSLEDVRRASRRPTGSWFFYNVPREQVVSEDAVVVLDHRRWYRKLEEQGWTQPVGERALKFTRGFAAVAGTIECLRPQRIVVVGMNILRDGMTGARYYDASALPWYVKNYPKLAMARPKWAADELPAGLTRETPHDYSAEAKLIRALAAEAGTELMWDGECQHSA